MKTMTLAAAALCGALLLLPGSPGARAQDAQAAHKGYMDAMTKMQTAMPKESSGDAEVDFARMMIPHHQSAIDMSEVLLKNGKDARLRGMAKKIIKDQKKEIAELQAWLKKRSK